MNVFFQNLFTVRRRNAIKHVFNRRPLCTLAVFTTLVENCSVVVSESRDHEIDLDLPILPYFTAISLCRDPHSQAQQLFTDQVLVDYVTNLNECLV